MFRFMEANNYLSRLDNFCTHNYSKQILFAGKWKRYLTIPLGIAKTRRVELSYSTLLLPVSMTPNPQQRRGYLSESPRLPERRAISPTFKIFGGTDRDGQHFKYK